MTKAKRPNPKATEAPLSITAQRLGARLRKDFPLGDAAGSLLLRSLLESYDRLQQARRILQLEGPMLRDRFDQAKPHPALAMERDARAQLHGALRLLRLEPSALQEDFE